MSFSCCSRCSCLRVLINQVFITSEVWYSEVVVSNKPESNNGTCRGMRHKIYIRHRHRLEKTNIPSLWNQSYSLGCNIEICIDEEGLQLCKWRLETFVGILRHYFRFVGRNILFTFSFFLFHFQGSVPKECQRDPMTNLSLSLPIQETCFYAILVRESD